MAAGTKLQLTFDTMGGSKTHTFNYAQPNSGTVNVKALGQAMINNGSIYTYPPLRLTAAKEVTTSENNYDLTSA